MWKVGIAWSECKPLVDSYKFCTHVEGVSLPRSQKAEGGGARRHIIIKKNVLSAKDAKDAKWLFHIAGNNMPEFVVKMQKC